MNRLYKIMIAIVTLMLCASGNAAGGVPDHAKVRLSLRIADAKRDMKKSGIYRSLIRKGKIGSLRRP